MAKRDQAKECYGSRGDGARRPESRTALSTRRTVLIAAALCGLAAGAVAGLLAAALSDPWTDGSARPAAGPDSTAARGASIAPDADAAPTAHAVTPPPAVAEMLAVVAHAEGLLRLGRADAALRAVASLPVAMQREPAVVRVRAWAILSDGRFADLDAILDGPELTGSESVCLKATAAARRGDKNGAAALLELWRAFPDSIWGLAALRELASSRRGGLDTAEQVAVTATLPAAGATTYLEEDDEVEARLASLKAAAPAHSRLAAEIEYALGVLELRHERFTQALAHLETVSSRHAPQELLRAAELQLAEALRRQGRYDEARERFLHLATSGSDRERGVARAAAGEMAIEHHRYAEAQELFRTQLLENPVGEARQVALWGLGWIAWRTASFREARRFFESLEREAPYGALAPRALYWGARALEEQGLRAQAQGELAALLSRFPLDYYAYRARERLGGVSAAPTALVTPPPRPEVMHLRALLASGHQRRAGLLLERLLGTSADFSPDELLLLADAAARARSPVAAAKVTALGCGRWRVFGDRCTEPAASLESEAATTLVRIARAERLPPAYLLGTAMIASNLDPSRVGAHGELGLLQTPKSALEGLWREVATHDLFGKRRPASSELVRADSDAALSARYFGRLVRSFDRRLEYALAALHAGPGAVTRWREARGDLPPEIFVEETPYAETAAWVRNVIARIHAVQLLTVEEGGPGRLAFAWGAAAAP